MSERSVFLAALEYADPTERSNYLDRVCAGDPALRASVEALLRASEGAINDSRRWYSSSTTDTSPD